jgi:hypothetical protein
MLEFMYEKINKAAEKKIDELYNELDKQERFYKNYI